MKLIGTYTSPFVRKVRIVLAEKKMDYEFVVESPWTADSKVPTHNPLGKVPVLLIDESTALYDSRVIAEHIDNITPNNKLYPAPNRERTEVKRWEVLADGICEAAATAVLEARRPAAQQSLEWIARQREKIGRSLEFLSEELGEQNFCMGGTHITMADIAVGNALGYLNFRFPDIDWRAAHPNLARLYDKLMQRPSFADSVPHD